MEIWVMVLFLGIGSAMDIQKKEIPAFYLGIFAVAGILVQMWNMMAGDAAAGNEQMQRAGWIAGGMAGLLLAGIGKVTKQAIGYGDAWTGAVLGIWLGVLPMAEIFFLGLLLSSVYASWLFLVRKKSGKYRIAFLPFLLAGYLTWIMFVEKGRGGWG